MSKRELEDLIRGTFAETEDATFDDQLLKAASHLLDVRAAEQAPALTPSRPRTTRSSNWIVGLLVAAVVLVALGTWVLFGQRSDVPAQEFELTRGSIELDAQASPIALTTPLGRVLLDEGRALVEILDVQSSVEEREAMRAKFAMGATALAAAVWVGVEVYEGEARVELDQRVVRIEAGEARLFAADPKPLAKTDALVAEKQADRVDRVGGVTNDLGTGEAANASERRRMVIHDEQGAVIENAQWIALNGSQRVAAATFRTAGQECQWVNAPADTVLSRAVRVGEAEDVAVPSRAGSAVDDGLPKLADALGAIAMEAPGFAPVVVFSVDEQNTEPLKVVLKPAVELEIHLVDQLGIPLAGFASQDAFACAETERNIVRLLVPLEDGVEAVVPLEHLGGGRFHLTTSAIASAVLEVAWAGVVTTRIPLSFDRSTTMPLKFEVPATEFIGGRVFRESGVAFPAVSVHMESFNEKGRRRLLSTFTDSEGWFRIQSYARVKRLRVQTEGFTAIERQDLSAPDGSLTFVMKPLIGAVIAGRIQDEAGLPLAGQRLRLVGADYVFNGHLGQVSDEQGNFRFGDLQAGRYEVRWDRPQPFIPFTSPELKLAPGEVRNDLVIAPPPAGRIVVHCLDAEGQPLKQGNIELNRQRIFGEPEYIAAIWLAQLDDPLRGDVALFDGVPPGRYAVVLDRGKQIETVRLREAETAEVTLGGKGALTLKGRIERDGQPITNAEVAAAPASGDILSARETRAAEDGRFELIGLKAGRILFRVSERDTRRTWFAAADYFAAPNEEIVLRAPEGEMELTLPPDTALLKKDARVRVTIDSLDGVDLRRSVPSAYRIVGEYAWGEQRELRITGLASGQYRIEVESDSRVLQAEAELRESFVRVLLRE